MRVWIFLLVIILHFVKSEEPEDVDLINAGIDGVIDSMTSIPVAGTIITAVAPLCKLVLKMKKKEKKDERVLNAIQTGFREMNTKLDQYMGRIENLIKLDEIRKVESIAGSLLQNMEDIYNEPDPERTYQAIQTFLKECEPDVPYKQILVMNVHMEKVLSDQYMLDIYHRRSEMEKVERRLYSSLHKLSLVYASQQYFRVDFSNETVAGRDSNLNKLERKLEEIREKTEMTLDSLRKYYWGDLEKPIARIMDGPGNPSAKADKILDYLSNLYTNDRFCIVVEDLKYPKEFKEFEWSKLHFCFLLGDTDTSCLKYYVKPLYADWSPRFSGLKTNFYGISDDALKISILKSGLAHTLTDSTEIQNIVKKWNHDLVENCRANKAKCGKEDIKQRPFESIITMKDQPNLVVKCDPRSSHSFYTRCIDWLGNIEALKDAQDSQCEVTALYMF